MELLEKIINTDFSVNYSTSFRKYGMNSKISVRILCRNCFMSEFEGVMIEFEGVMIVLMGFMSEFNGVMSDF